MRFCRQPTAGEIFLGCFPPPQDPDPWGEKFFSPPKIRTPGGGMLFSFPPHVGGEINTPDKVLGNFSKSLLRYLTLKLVICTYLLYLLEHFPACTNT